MEAHGSWKGGSFAIFCCSNSSSSNLKYCSNHGATFWENEVSPWGQYR